MTCDNANGGTIDLHWVCATNSKKLAFQTVANKTKAYVSAMPCQQTVSYPVSNVI
jgi:hypothetical protein